MSEVVPLPSFGEVFFDARGQDRVLRVTWHEGTLVLSLWRGEMCTASFRMPMDDVGRLLETLQVGYAEATGQAAGGHEQPGTGPFPAPDLADYPGEYPGTGQYSRPPAPEQQQPMPPQQPFPPFPQEQQPMPAGWDPGPYPEATPAYGQPAPAAPAALGPNDVLVARGAPTRDRLVAVDQQAPPRERPRRAAPPPPDFPPFDGQVPAEPVYQFPSPIPGRPAYQFDPEPDGEAGQHQQQPFPGGDVYQADATVYQTGSYQPPQVQQPPMPPQQQMPPQQLPPQQPYPPFPPEPQRPHLVQAPPPFPPEPFGQGDPQGYPQGYAQGAVYSTDPSFQPPPVQQQYPPQPQYADPRYQQQPPQQPGVDPNDPLGLGGPVARPYVEGQPPMYSTGERVRPEGADDRRDWS
ncbi:hypothetical protein [Herbidospora daliensis]|uniref:hypothetical protein n=1 Tax=Herbidospora daliensis TaxID=295585 RepID=UPI0007829DEF|nr:hypothetical protein [Herbidospora daliensis]